MIKKLVKSFVIIAILFCSSFLICRYIKYKSLEQIYLDIFSESYGTTDTGKILEKILCTILVVIIFVQSTRILMIL